MHSYILRVVLLLEEYVVEAGSVASSGGLCCQSSARAWSGVKPGGAGGVLLPGLGTGAYRAQLCLLPHLPLFTPARAKLAQQIIHGMVSSGVT